ncbi:MAG TPA: OsmC family protein, partial [Candidatus Berkiella sp.]|nr:OsmC family protein [Candidatus Berkiella sp.]
MDNNTDNAILTVSSSEKGKYAQEIIVGKHLLIGDEPVAVGGNDLGPSPYDYLLTALGTCTSMTLRMFADLKKIPLEKVTVNLKHEKKYATDCAECENNTAKLDHIE